MAIEVSGMMLRIPQGDTGTVKFAAEEGELAGEDQGVFTLARRDGAAILRKILTPDLKENAFRMAIVHEDTARLRPGQYEWSLRVIRGGTFDEAGRLTDAQSQNTAVLRGKMSVLSCAGGVR